MLKKRRLKIVFMGGSQAGIIGALTVLAGGNEISAAVGYSDELRNILKFLHIPVYKSIKEEGFIKKLKRSNLLLSVHGREVVEPALLNLPKLRAVNIHPYLYKYKGADPVGRALKDKEFHASVGAHLMEEKVDEGRVLVEEFIDANGARSRAEIYNQLYPLYAKMILKVLDMVSQGRIRYEKKDVR